MASRSIAIVFIFWSEFSLIDGKLIFQEDCLWSEWSEWSDCSKTCGGGTHTANRTIMQIAEHGGKECRGKGSIKKSCNRNICPGKLFISDHKIEKNDG